MSKSNDYYDRYQQPKSITEMEKRELIFQLSEAVRSTKKTAINDFKAEKEQKIRQTEEDILKLCKK